MTKDSVKVVGTYLARNARLLARACDPSDREAALAFADLLSQRPEEVLRAGQDAPKPAPRRRKAVAA